MQYNQCTPRKRTWNYLDDEQFYSDAIKTPRFGDIEYVSVDVFKATAQEESKQPTISTKELMEWCEKTPIDLISLLTFDTFEEDNGFWGPNPTEISGKEDTECIFPQDLLDRVDIETERIDSLINHKLVGEVVTKKERVKKANRGPNIMKLENPQEYELVKAKVIRCIGNAGSITVQRIQYSLKRNYLLLCDIVHELIDENVVVRTVTHHGGVSSKYALNKRFI